MLLRKIFNKRMISLASRLQPDYDLSIENTGGKTFAQLTYRHCEARVRRGNLFNN